MTTTTNEPTRWQQFLQSSMLWLFAATLTLGLTLVFSLNYLVTISPVDIEVGDIAVQDLFAPRTVTYESQVMLQDAREQARANVAEQYVRPADIDIGREQLRLVDAVFAFMDTVRADTLATTETKISYIQGIENLNIDEQVAVDLLGLSSADYEEMKTEVARIVGELMRDEIHEDQLRDYQRTAAREASLFLSPTQENVVTNLAPQFIVPTVVPDPEATAELRDQAAAAVQPFPVTVEEGELILAAGDRVTALDVEKLTMVGLIERENVWQDVGAVFMAVLVGVIILTIYWDRFHRSIWQQNNVRYLSALEVLILIFALAASLILVNNSTLIYWFPMAALAMLLGVVFETRLSIVVTLFLATLIGYSGVESLELAMYTAVGGLLAVLTLQDVQRMNGFFRSGLIAAVGYSIVIILFRFPQGNIEAITLFRLLGTAVSNGILSAALTMVGLFVVGSVFGITTTLQLQDLSRLDHPLLQELLRRAPGTYHHSIMVANLAEQASDQIKANSTLIRVGAFYHDIGKMNRPPFFTENQEGVNPHDTLDPYTSTRIIISHVTDGLELARQYKLPDRIQEFIAQHHGRRIVKGFYYKAKEQAGENEEVDVSQFKYPGPRPRSRETGIVMLADAVESASRALQPNSEKAIEKLVNSLIDDDLTEGQLDESGLTLGDISLIRASFIKTLKGRFHVRVKYPGNEALEVTDERPQAAATAVANHQTANQQPAKMTPSVIEDVALRQEEES